MANLRKRRKHVVTNQQTNSTSKATTKEIFIPTLNHDCLSHIFQFLRPEDWATFSQVCTSWKHAATSKDCQKLIYKWVLPKLNCKTLELPDFLKILKFVAPQLKNVEIQRNVKMGRGTNRHSTVSISLGRFNFTTSVKKIKEEFVMSVLLKDTEKVEKMKINSFEGGRKVDWEKFFQKNDSLKYFKFTAETIPDQKLLEDFVSILPDTLEQVGFDLMNGYYEYNDMPKLVQCLQKLPVLTKLHLSISEQFMSKFAKQIAEVISKHANTLEKLCLILHESIRTSKHKSKNKALILNSVPECRKLEKLNLTNFSFEEGLCRSIVENCHAIKHLKFDHSGSLKPDMKLLTSLPNLSELCVNSIKWIKPTGEVQTLKKLVKSSFHDAQFARALPEILKWMPNLSTLVWYEPFRFALDSKTLCLIKQSFISRGQNIVLHQQNDKRPKNENVKKFSKIEFAPDSNQEFKFVVVTDTQGFLKWFNKKLNSV